MVSDPKQGGGVYRVLIVDDNPLIRDSVKLAAARLAKQQGAVDRPLKMFEARDGVSAWQILEKEPIDLVITDIYIPVLNGLELIQRIRETPATASIKILAISASIQDARARSMSAGANTFLQKPLRLTDLLEALQALLRSGS